MKLNISCCLNKILVIVFTISFSSHAQTEYNTISKLNSQVKEATTDSVRIIYQMDLVKYVLNRDMDTAKIVVKDVLATIEKNQTNDLYFKTKKAIALNYLAIIDAKQSFSEKALINYLKALEIAEETKDSLVLGLTIHNMGMFYRRLKQYDKAKEYLNRAIVIRESIEGEPDDIAMTYNMLGVTHFYEKQYDSALVKYNKAKKLYSSRLGKTKVNGNIALLYYSSGQFNKAISVFQENVEIFKELGILNELTITYQNLAASYNGVKAYDKTIATFDSAIAISKKLNHKERLRQQYKSRSSAYVNIKDYEKALKDYELFKIYNDSLNNIDEAKRITELELNYKFEKERIEKELAIQNEKAKKQWYLAMLILFMVLTTIIFLLIKKNIKNRLDLASRELENEQLQRKTTEQILQIKDAELKNETLNSQIRQEYHELFINELKSILKLNSEVERTQAIKSLLLSLKSKSTDFTATQGLINYLDKVSPDFKIKLKKYFSFLNEKERNILYLMKLGLSTNEIKDVQNISLASVKSIRYRIRKKLGIESDDNIIGYIEQYASNE